MPKYVGEGVASCGPPGDPGGPFLGSTAIFRQFSDNALLHNPVSRNCAVSMLYTYIVLLHNLNSTKLHLQGVAPRSQYSDHAPEAVMLQQFAPIIAHEATSQ